MLRKIILGDDIVIFGKFLFESRFNVKHLCLSVLNICLVFPNSGYADDAKSKPAPTRDLVENMQFIQIPGPNPIITPGPDGAWDDGVTEASDAFRDVGTYYFYYHAIAEGSKSYQLGVAHSPGPLGPFKKHGDKPILEVGPEGSWEATHVACAMILKEGPEEYYMWYSGYGSNKSWDIGLATAKHPLGPWKKHEGNPVLRDFGYMGGVVKVDGKYRLYSAYPISHIGYKGDYSPLSLAMGDKPEGPYVKYRDNPLMEKGNFGDWDDGGISEAEVLYHNGMYHMFYGGTELFGPRLEHVGYAYSFDGYEFFKYAKNPVAVRQVSPNTAALAEVHTIIEPPFIYLYYTLRPALHEGKKNYPWVENLGVEVLVTQRPFSLNMPVINLDRLAPGGKTSLDDSPPLCLGHIERVAITVECAYESNATKPVQLHIVSSADGLTYDTSDLYTFELDLQCGQTARKTFELDTKVRFIKVIVENRDKSESVSNISITASLSG
ncbi:MAG: hypothetical protein JXD22_13630 [Sedimentisphaerales bacterium]|nr:hypothetical protein [Sedimentisphaerales bacterium]